MRRRKENGLQAERVRVALRLSHRDGRRPALGTFEPSVEQISSLEQMLSLPTARLRPNSFAEDQPTKVTPTTKSQVLGSGRSSP